MPILLLKVAEVRLVGLRIALFKLSVVGNQRKSWPTDHKLRLIQGSSSDQLGDKQNILPVMHGDKEDDR